MRSLVVMVALVVTGCGGAAPAAKSAPMAKSAPPVVIAPAPHVPASASPTAPTSTVSPPPPPSAELLAFGKHLFLTEGCSACHRRHQRMVGPPLHALRGSRIQLRDGSYVKVTPDFVRSALIDPKHPIVMGYEPVMPTYRGHLTPQQLDALVAYVMNM